MGLSGKKVNATGVPAAVIPDASTTATSKGALRADALSLREAQSIDLESVNELIAAAMNSWNLTDRVKRISLPLYRYQAHDLEHLHLVVAESGDTRITGVAALEPAATADTPQALAAWVLHGLYVAPDQHRKGIGSLLLGKIEKIARAKGSAGLLVKARPEAVSFFESRGFEKLAVENQLRDYPYRFWKYF